MSSGLVTERAWVPLTARERRVVGVMVEKQKTTPEYYPMSVAAVVTACNQKSNRDPLTNYDADDVEEILQGLRQKGAAVMIEGGGRVVKWKHTLYDWLGLRGKAVEMAVLAELLLRGKQTEGDLRGRASRMETIPDLDALHAILATLVGLDLAVYLTPSEVKRGAVVTHNLYSLKELEAIRQDFAKTSVALDESPRSAPAATSMVAITPPADPGLRDEVAGLREIVEALQTRVEAMADELRDLKSSLGA